MPFRPSAPAAPPPKRKRGRPPAPSEISSGLAPPSAKGKQAPSPEDVRPSFTSPTAPLPTGPPVKPLQKYGVHLSIYDLNDRVERIADAYRTKFGMLPSWGLVFDLIRSPVDDFHHLFSVVPHSEAVARAQGALRAHGGGGGLAPVRMSKQNFATDLIAAAQENRLTDFLAENRDNLTELYADKKMMAQVQNGLANLHLPSVSKATKEAHLSEGEIADVMLKQAGLGSDLSQATKVGGGAVALGATQIVHSLAYAPVGGFFMARAGYHDVGGAVHGDVSFKRTRKMGVAMGKSVLQDVRHPLENPGYLFLDVLGVVSAGAGIGVRVTRTAAALREGEGLGVAARTLASRPVGGTYALRKGGHEEHVLLFENPVAQVAQRAALRMRQGALNRRELEPLVRQPLSSGMLLDLSTEAKLAREAESVKRVQRAGARSYTSELEDAAGWSLVSSQVFARMPYVVRRSGEKLPGHAPFGLTRGEQKAIQVLATDDPNPLQLHRDFHNQMKMTPSIGEAFGLTEEQFVANHDRHLADLKMAEGVLTDLADGKARPRFVRALEETRRVIDEQERLKIEELGLLPDTAERRIIAPADVMREGKALPNVEAIRKEIIQLEQNVKRRGPLAEAERHLKRLQGQYETTMRQIEERVAPYDVRAEQARRNLAGREGKRTRGRAVEGRAVGKEVKSRTVASEVSQLAVQKIEELLRENPDNPALQRFAQIREDMVQLDQAIQIAKRAKAGDIFLEGSEQSAGRILASIAGATSTEGRRLTKLRKDLAAGEARLEDFTRTSEESFYLPFVPKRHARSVPHEIIRRARFGPFGVPRPRDLSELKHVFTGRSIIAGDFRVDATSLAGEAYGRTVRLVSIRNDHARLLKMAEDTQAKAGPFAVPIRELEAIPPRLRERLAKIDEGEFTSADAESLSAGQVDKLLKELYPDPAEEIQGVKWVDARLIADEGIRTVDGRIVGRTHQAAPMAGFFDVVNEPFRLSYLFLRPAYALNFLGNAAMGLIHQGVFLPLNLARAYFAADHYGADVARAMDYLTGEGKMQAIAETAGKGKLTAGSRAIAHSWSVITDRHFRRAALIHELRRLGYRTPEEVRAALFDESNLKDLVEAHKRGSKAMVQFDNLTHYEKSVLRHVIFVYPWVSRSAVWSIRTLVEHPVQSAILAQLGREGEAQTKPLFEHMPDWVKRVGYVPIGFDALGNPKVLNFTSINTFSTLNDLVQLGRGGETPEDLSSPLVEIGIRAFTGADQYGQRYKGAERFYGPVKGSIEQIPLVRGIEGPKQPAAQKPLDLSDKRMLVKREREALKSSVLYGGWLGAWGGVIGGGLSPRELNLSAAEARFWRDRPLEERNKHERALIQEGLTIQGKTLLKEDVPRAVREAVDIAGEETLARAQHAKQIGREVYADTKEGALIDIGVLQKRGKLTTIEAKGLTARLKKLPDSQSVKRFIRTLHSDYGGADELRNWQADTSLVASFTPGAVKARLEGLRKQGLAGVLPAKLEQPALYELGRRVLAFQRELGRRSKAHKDLPSAERSIADAELRAYQDSQDKPVTIDGHTFPSLVRLTWSMLTPQEQADHRITITTSDWQSLSAFEKHLLGRKSSADVSKGWANFRRILAAYRGQVPMQGIAPLPIGQRSIPYNWKVYFARYVDKGETGYIDAAPGFYKDWLFSQEPKYRRLQHLKPIQDSRYAPQWNHLFTDANVLGRLLKDKAYSHSSLKETWHDYVNGEEFQTWLKRTPAGFRHELERYGPNFLPGLLS